MVAISLILFVLLFCIFYYIENPDIIKTLFFWKPSVEFTDKSLYMKAVHNYDLFMIFGYRNFQLILPLLAILPTIAFHQEIIGMFQHCLIRRVSYSKFLVGRLLRNSLLIAVALYAMYVLVVIASSFVFPIISDGTIQRGVFADLLGIEFYANNKILYYCLEGVLKVFLACFAYSLISHCICLFTYKKILPVIIPIIIHLFLVFILPIFLGVLPFINYFMPQNLLNPGGMFEPKTILLLIGFIPYYLISFIMIKISLNNKERLGG